MNETGLQLNSKPGNGVAIKGSKNITSITSGKKSKTVSVLACASAEGTFLPPYCIMKGKNLKVEFMDGMPSGLVVKMSQKSSYVTSEIFLCWLRSHFEPGKLGWKVLLLLDGHTLHTSLLEVLVYTEQEGIILMSIPPHTSHWLQHLDRPFFKSLKSYFYSACNYFITNNPSRKTNHLQFGKLLNSAWTKAAGVQNSVSGFQACGIVPLDMSVIPAYAYLEPDSSGAVPIVQVLAHTLASAPIGEVDPVASAMQNLSANTSML
ncbi:uncharacterized protein [Diabrotica undecimpunctata]|uniref:uncharacterized protein n=1 Tax=Diabrotica undecimpunctata TaxID=50387 RepID=UPI003B63A474